MPPWPHIPYGETSFPRIRRNGWLYVDKTRFLRPLEDERYVFFIRPRRFGKSCWLSLLEGYYGRHRASELEALFGGTDIGSALTADRGRYVIVRLDFSAFTDKLETLEERFEGYCDLRLQGALERNADLFPDEARRHILSHPAIDTKLNALFEYAGEYGIPLYILIDEYDNFANTVPAHRGREAYESFIHGGGFYRNFFATPKAEPAKRAASNGCSSPGSRPSPWATPPARRTRPETVWHTAATMNEPVRCAWVGDDPIHVAYHDDEWCVPSHGDRYLFEMLILEGAQAGLNWRLILGKREGYRRACDGFDPVRVASWDEAKIERLAADPGIVRNRLKIRAARANARAALAVIEEHGGLAPFFWSFVDGVPIVNRWRSMAEMPASTPLSERLSRELKRLGFQFVGPTICYSFLQAIGIVDDHTRDCFRCRPEPASDTG